MGDKELTSNLVHDLVSMAKKLDNLQSMVLYGSFATGIYDSRSDIDLLLVYATEYNPETGREFDIAVELFGQLEKKYNRQIELTLTNLKDIDTVLLSNIAKEGIQLWGRPIVLSSDKLGLTPHNIISYFPKNNNKACTIYRALNGYKIKKKYKNKIIVSENEGILELFSGIKIGRGSVLLNMDGAKIFKDILEKEDVSYKSIEVWV